MKFVLIIDETTSTNKFVSAVKEKLNCVSNSLSDVKIDTYILHDSKPIDSDTNLLLKILLSESNRIPLIVDAKTAKYYPEILKLQTSIVMFEHETNMSLDINEYNIFSETLAASHGAKIDYIDKEFHDNENSKHLNVIDIEKHIATVEYYIYLAKMFYYEHIHYPIILLPRSIQKTCNGDCEELKKYFDNRLNLNEFIGMNPIKTDSSDFKNKLTEIDKTFCDIAVHSLNDTRIQLQTKKMSLHIKRL